MATRNKFVATAGTKFYFGDEPGTEATADILAAAITQLSNVKRYPSLPNSPITTYDTTRLDQVDENGDASFIEQFGLSYEAPGNLEFDLGMDETQVAQAYTLKDSRTFYAFKILFKSGATLSWIGAVIDVKPVAGEKDEITYAVMIKPATKPVFTPATAKAILTKVTMLGAHTVTLDFSGTIGFGDFIPGNILLNHAGTITPGGTVTAGPDGTKINVAAAGFPTNPVGDTVALQVGPSYVSFPGTKLVVTAG